MIRVAHFGVIYPSLPPKVEIAIFIINEELKSVKFTNELHKRGTDASDGILDLTPLTSAIMGFGNNLTDEFQEWYFDRQSQLVETIDREDDKKLLEKAFDFYVDLVVKKRELERMQRSLDSIF